MRNVEVAADDDGLFRTQIEQECAKRILPRHAVFEPLECALCVRRVDRDEIDIIELHRDDASLVVMLGDADAVGHRERLHARKDRCARVALFLRTVKILLVAGQIEDRLPLLHLRLLQAEGIGVELLERLHEALFEGGAQAVDIP